MSDKEGKKKIKYPKEKNSIKIKKSKKYKKRKWKDYVKSDNSKTEEINLKKNK